MRTLEKQTKALAFLGFLSLAVMLCSLAACGSLDKSGPYAGDKVLYDADLGIGTTYDLLHTFVSWEYQNRPLLSSQPEITQAADNVRTHAPEWISSAIALRDAYRGDPSDANRTALQQALDTLRQVVAEVTAYMARQPMPGSASTNSESSTSK